MENRRQRLRVGDLGWLGLTLLWMLLSGCGTGTMPSRVEIQPASVAVKAPCTQHEVVAYVTDAEGKPIGNCLVEWTLPRSWDAVGAIVEAPDLWGSKKTNTYARTKTDEHGKARITITSTQEGRTPIIALAPDIADKKHHKVFAVQHWLKAAWNFPSDQPAKAGGWRDIATYVYRASCDDTDRSYPLPGYRVEWEILANFKVTPHALESLAAHGLSGDVLQPLETIKDQQFLGKRAFLSRIVELIDQELADEHKYLILEHTKNAIGPPAYFKDPITEEKATHIIVESDTRGISSIRLYQDEDRIVSGKNEIGITIRHPDNTEELCCPNENDIVGSWQMTQTWTPEN